MVPRGASPTEDPAAVEANLCGVAEEHSAGDGNAQAAQPTAGQQKQQQYRRPNSLPIGHQTDGVRNRHVVAVDDEERKALAKVTIPLTVCLLEPVSTENPTSLSKAATRSASASDLAPGVLFPSNDGTNDQRGLNLVLAPELLVR